MKRYRFWDILPTALTQTRLSFTEYSGVTDGIKKDTAKTVSFRLFFQFIPSKAQSLFVAL
jgi:hypothetical protein